MGTILPLREQDQHRPKMAFRQKNASRLANAATPNRLVNNIEDARPTGWRATMAP